MDNLWKWLGYSDSQALEIKETQLRTLSIDVDKCSPEDKLYYEAAIITEESHQLGLEVWAISERWRSVLMPVPVQKTLQLKAQKLQELQEKMMGVAADYINLVQQSPAGIVSFRANASEPSASNGTQVKDSDLEDESAAPRPSRIKFSEEKRTHRFLARQETIPLPDHGHFVPEEIRETTVSFQHECARRLGGRIVTVGSEDSPAGLVECVLVEPMKKYLGDPDFVGAGVVFFLHGLKPSMRLVQEWNQVLNKTKVLDNGISVVIPDLHGSIAVQPGALQPVLLELVEITGARRFMVWGKGWGAMQALEVSGMESFRDKLTGVFLLSPATPLDNACQGLASKMRVPVYMLWPKGDKTVPAESKNDWSTALKQSSASVIWRDVSSSGQDMARLLKKNYAVALEVLHFTAAAFLKCQLAELMDLPCDVEGNEVMPGEESLILVEELPESFVALLGRAEDNDTCVRAAFELQCSKQGPKAAAQKLCALLDFWMSSNLQMASSSE